MKQIFVIISFLFPFMSLAQMTDTTCIKYRWIALKPTEVNKDVFLLDSTYGENLDLVFTIKRLVEENKMNIYNQNKGPFGMKGWYYIDYHQEMENKLKDSISYWGYDPYFEIIVQADMPLVDMYGEDSLYFENGGWSIVYPLPDIFIFPSKICDEIRIKEERVYNDSTKKFEYSPVGLSFYFKGHNYWRGHEKFWVDLRELFEVIEDKSKYPWYEAIVNKNYQGFQYMQVSCYDDEIKN